MIPALLAPAPRRGARSRIGLGLAALVAVLAAGCASYPVKEGPPAPDLAPWRAAIDWEAAGRETAELLAGYLRVDTVNPPGNETRGASYLADVLAKDGIASEIVEMAPGRGSLIARIGPDASQAAEPPLCLLSHIDVVSSVEKDWPEGKGPLSGTIDADGMIWGRGALDMKGMGAIETMTLVWLKRLGVPLRREVILLAVADEEVDNEGMQFVVDQHWGRIGCSQLVNEGGVGLRDMMFEGQTVYPITVIEKGVLWLRLTVRGEGGHGSTPRPEHTPRELLVALAAIDQRPEVVAIHRALYELLARVGAHHGGVPGFVLEHPDLVDSVVIDKLLDNPATHAAITDTCTITGLDAGQHEPNVVPNEASAILDCRLLPGTKPEAMVARLVQAIERVKLPGTTYAFDVLQHAPALESPWEDDSFYRALAQQVVAGRSDAVAGPALSVGFTDSLYARQKGVHAYGLVPFEITQAEATTMHGIGERVSIANVRTGLRILFSAVVQAAADLTQPPRAHAPGAVR